MSASIWIALISIVGNGILEYFRRKERKEKNLYKEFIEDMEEYKEKRRIVLEAEQEAKNSVE